MKQVEGLAPLLAALHNWQQGVNLPPPDAARQAEWRRRLATGLPALREEDFPAALAVAALAVLLQREKKAAPPAVLQQVIAAYAAGNVSPSLYAALDLPVAAGNLLVHLASQAALSTVAARVRQAVNLADWRDHTCPVCGTAPWLSILTKDGHRELLCSACLTRWRYKRIGCARCGQEDPHRLRVLAVEGYPGWTIMACLACRGYIKNADLQVLGTPPDWRQAQLDTLPLDFAAAKWLSQPCAS